MQTLATFLKQLEIPVKRSISAWGLNTQNHPQKEEYWHGRAMPSPLLLPPHGDGDQEFPPAWEILPRVSASIKLKPPWSLPLKASVSQSTSESAHVWRGAFGNALRMVPIGAHWTGFLGAGGTGSLRAAGSLWFLPTACVNPRATTCWVSFSCWSPLGGGKQGGNW